MNSVAHAYRTRPASGPALRTACQQHPGAGTRDHGHTNHTETGAGLARARVALTFRFHRPAGPTLLTPIADFVAHLMEPIVSRRLDAEWRHAHVTSGFLAIQRHATPLDRQSQPRSGPQRSTRNLSPDLATFTWTEQPELSRPVQSFHREVVVSRDPQDRRGHDHRDRPVQLCISGDTPASPAGAGLPRSWLRTRVFSPGRPRSRSDAQL